MQLCETGDNRAVVLLCCCLFTKAPLRFCLQRTYKLKIYYLHHGLPTSGHSKMDMTTHYLSIDPSYIEWGFMWACIRQCYEVVVTCPIQQSHYCNNLGHTPRHYLTSHSLYTIVILGVSTKRTSYCFHNDGRYERCRGRDNPLAYCNSVHSLHVYYTCTMYNFFLLFYDRD